MEFLQNMSKHGLAFNGKQEGLLLIGEREGEYLIGGSNYVEHEEKKRLEERISDYNLMDINALNDSYKKRLKEGDPDNKNGAGLGLIEIARRSSKKIEYNFKNSKEHTIFNMLLQI